MRWIRYVWEDEAVVTQSILLFTLAAEFIVPPTGQLALGYDFSTCIICNAQPPVMKWQTLSIQVNL